jgi:hypothetical protein
MIANRLTAAVLFIFVALAILPLPTNPPPMIGVEVLPRVALAPSDMRIVVRVAPHADNRGVDLLLTDGLPRRRSWIPIEGEDGPSIVTIWWKDMPAGAYEIIATLMGSTGTRGEGRTTVTLLAPPQESAP